MVKISLEFMAIIFGSLVFYFGGIKKGLIHIKKKYFSGFIKIEGTVFSNQPRGLTEQELEKIKNDKIGSKLLNLSGDLESQALTSKDYSLLAAVYEYIVDGRKYYLSDNIYLKYPKKLGKKKVIIYNPANPSDAIFNTDYTIIIALLVGSLFIILGILLLLNVV